MYGTCNRVYRVSSLSRFEAHVDFFRLSMKGIFDAYLLWPFGKKLISILQTGINSCDFTIIRKGKSTNYTTDKLFTALQTRLHWLNVTGNQWTKSFYTKENILLLWWFRIILWLADSQISTRWVEGKLCWSISFGLVGVYLGVYWKFTIGGLLHCRSSLKGSFGRLFGSLLGNLHWRDQFKDPLRHSSGDCL